ncbi:MAG: SAM-dependent methyltransferase [Gemmatimonadetes bacterium]|nr:MAG: SAM-dependent methyltransferase [Gemmatimonadota bacterium]PYO71931.1 MAG: SAM-dependent methyltransferase [Gemmatimonadota bacterium]TLY46642.1 MAG: FkbM family methyltransferase [Gemmatimonadota bacterium]
MTLIPSLMIMEGPRTRLIELKGRAKAILGPAVVSYLKARFNLSRKRTYSQFGEDAFLVSYFQGKNWNPRSSGSGKLRSTGCYVDIGAYSPTECSNTHIFYQRGWRGINIDATPESVRAFDLVRKQDINLHCAIGSHEGPVSLYAWDRPSVFNTLCPEVARQRERELGRPPEVVSVPCLRLETVLQRHLPGGTEIDFLNVDAEGADLDVLRSNNWDSYRPELVVVEDYVGTFDDLSDSPVRTFLRDQGYEIHAWIRPSIIYRRTS